MATGLVMSLIPNSATHQVAAPTAPDLAGMIRDPAVADRVPRDAIPGLLSQLSAVQIALTARLLLPVPESAHGQPVPAAERLLTVGEAAQLLGVRSRWLYRHHRQLPFARRLSRKALRFSESGLHRWLAQQRRHD
jgi:excisionase family DNA binding protein